MQYSIDAWFSECVCEFGSAVAFDHVDNMHAKYVEDNFKLASGGYPCHIVGSSEAFVTMALNGVAYCLISEKQVAVELKSKKLIKISDRQVTRMLYWHRWAMLRGVHKKLSDQLVGYAADYLKQ